MRDSEIAISVVVPMFNAVQYLESCFDNLRCQGISNLEVIVVDDCSSDNSVAIVKKYCSKYPAFDVTVLEHKKNSGASSARNTGLAAARGDYVTFVDSDDVIPTGALSSMFRLAVARDSDIVAGDITTFRYRDGDIVKRKYAGLESNGIFRYELTGDLRAIPRLVYSVSCWGKLYRRRFLEKHKLRFDPRYRYAEDHLFVISAMVRAERLSVCPTVVYEYRIDNTSSVTSTLSSEYFGCISEVIPTNLSQLRGWAHYYYSRRVLDYELLQNVRRISCMSYFAARNAFSLLRSTTMKIDSVVRCEFIKENPQLRWDCYDLIGDHFHSCLARHHVPRVRRFLRHK